MNAPADSSKNELTLGMIEAAYKRAVEAEPRPICGSRERPHCVHPRASGWTICAECFGPVYVGVRS